MKLSLFKRMMDQFNGWGRKPAIKFFFLGEPLLHPQLAEMLSYAYAKGLSVTVQTNGMLLNKENSKWLLQYAAAVAFSVDAADAKTYEKIRVGGDFKKVVANIKRLCKLKKKMKSETLIDITIIIPDDDAEASQLLSKLIKFWDAYDLIISPIQLQNYDAPPKKRETVCDDGLGGLVVRWNGKITFCCGDIHCKLPIGDANRDVLETVWRGDLLNAIRLRILNKAYYAISVCRDCPLTDFGIRTLSLPKHYLDKLLLPPATRKQSLAKLKNRGNYIK